MPKRPLLSHAVFTLVIALIAGACSSARSAETTTTALALPETTTSSSTSSTTTSTSTTIPPPPTLTLRGDIPSPLKTAAEQFYDHLIDPANPAPALAAGIAEHVSGHTVEPGVVDGQGTVAGLENGDQVGVVVTDADGLVFVDPAGPDGWRLVAAMLDGLPPWLGPPGLRNLLVIGTDARVGEDQLDLRADSVHILSLLPRHGTGSLVGFPRDSWIRGSKLTNLMPGGGPEGMVEIIQDTSGIDLEGYVAVGFEGFLGLMEDLGDLAIDLPKAMNSGNSWDDYPEGPQTLDPQLTLRLARIRKGLPQGDFDRSVNQGRIILAALTMVQENGLLYLPAWVASYTRHGFTDLDTDALVTFAATAHMADPDAITNMVLPGSVGWVGAASVVFLGNAADAVYADLADGLIGNE